MLIKSAMPSSSKTNSPLAKKLQVKAGQSWLFYNAPEDYLSTIGLLPENVQVHFLPSEPLDGVQLFVIDSTELAASLKLIAPALKQDTVFWVIYSKKNAGIKTDLEMSKSWEEPAKYGLRPVAAAAINENWTAIRLRPIEQAKVSEFCGDQVEKKGHAAYIDLENRQIMLPPDLKAALEKKPMAMSFFQGLSFTNKKEYVVWLLSAKQEKTRIERLEKAVEKLLNSKKNPSEK